MKHVIGIGHSHLHAISRAFRETEASSDGAFRYTPICLLDAPFNASLRDTAGEPIPNHPVETTVRQVLDSGAEVSIFMTVLGSEAFRWSLTPGPNPFDFVDPFEDDGQPLAGEIIPYGLMEVFGYENLRFVGDVAAYIRSFAPLPLAQIAPPPPVSDLPALIAALPDWADKISAYGVSPLPFRSKVWRFACRTISTICARANIMWLPCPPEALGSDGGLHPDMRDDVIHANIAWGRLFRDRLLADHAPNHGAPA